MAAERTAVALGLFDGVHLGHRFLLNVAVESGTYAVRIYVNPETVAIKSRCGYIYNKEEKDRLLAACGIEQVYSVDFCDVCGMSGEEFVKNILVDRLNAGFVCCGNSFRFGKNALCGIVELCKLGRKYGFDTVGIDDVTYEGETVSSTAVRKMLLNGDTLMAGHFLGEPYTIGREVAHGAELGSTIGFPTINQFFGEGQLVPKYGVYASEVYINGRYRAVTNIGIKPTVSYGGRPLAETHILDFSGDLYGKTISVRLRDFIRSERKFSSVDELKSQISEDVRAALIILA